MIKRLLTRPADRKRPELRASLIKVLIFLAVMFSTNAFGAAFSQNVSVSFVNTPLRTVFKQFRAQTGLFFVYNEEEIDHSSCVNVTSNKILPIDKAMELVLSGLPYSFVITDDSVVIKPKPADQQQPQQPQRKFLTGVVTDPSGAPLAGVAVMVKGTGRGVSTDSKGNYRLEVGKGETVRFSFMGMKSREVVYADQKELNVRLEEQAQKVEDVVVTGFQVVDKRTLTSSISTITADDLDKVGALSIDQMLEGKATGLMVTTLASQPGAASKIRVRGAGSFTGSREPLWVIDGVPYEDPVPLEASEINSLDNINLIGNAITGLNPQDIESINVLKDASATAVYGSRAANGVIVITTKRGKKGSPSLSYQGSLSAVNRPSYSNFNLMNSKERIDVSREMFDRQLTFETVSQTKLVGYEGAVQTYWSDGDFDKFQNSVSKMEKLNFDWFDELYRPALTQAHSVSLSGGSDNMRYYTSLGYNNEKGTEKGVGLERITARSNLDINLRSNVLVSIGIDGSVQSADYNHSSINVFDQAYYSSRAVGAYDDNGDLFYLQSKIRDDCWDNNGNYIYDNYLYAKYNVIHEMNSTGRKIENKAFNINASLQWDITKHLRFTSRVAYRNTTNKTEEWANESSNLVTLLRGYDLADEVSDYYIRAYSVVPAGGIYSNGFVGQTSKSIRNQLNYSRNWGKHIVNANFTQEASSVRYKGATGWASPGYYEEQGNSFTYLPSVSVSCHPLLTPTYQYLDAVQWLTGQSSYSIYPTITNTLTNTLSWVGILTYSYDNRYILNFNIRQDGSNAFGQYEKNRFRPSWSVSGRWNIHDEKPFLDKMWLNELALRASYGYRGTAPNVSPSLILSSYTQGITQYYPEYVSSLSSFPNANLRWEKSATFNAGLNFALFDNRLTGAFDYSYTKATDLLLTRPVSLVNGIGAELYNGGAKEDHTYEFNIIGQPIRTKDWGWSVNLNLTYLKENILVGSDDATISIDKYLNGTIMTEGFPVDGFFSYHFTGLNEEGLPTFDGLAETYDTVYERMQAGMVYSGNRLPKFYGGFGTEVRWRNLTLSANFTYKIGQVIRLLPLYSGATSMPRSNENMSAEFVNRWRKAGDEATTDIPRLNATQTSLSEVGIKSNSQLFGSYTTLEKLYDMSDARTAKGDYIRLSTLTLSYRIPTLLSFNNLTLRFQATNLGVITFDPKLKGQDPEQVNSIGLPSLPTYTFGLNIGF